MAKKPNISTVASGYQGTVTINNNFDNVRNQFDNTLSLDGSTPNAMLADLDMNSNDILNAGEVSVASLRINSQPVVPTSVVYNGIIKETKVATSGQTVFNLTTISYTPNTNNLSIYVDGVYQKPANYTENSATQVTFSTGLHVGAIVDFVVLSIGTLTGTADATNITYTPAAQSLYGTTSITVKSALDQVTHDESGSSKVGFLQSGTSATKRTVQDKLRDAISVKDFGAVGNGIVDDAAAINAALTAAKNSSTKEVLLHGGTYLVGSTLVIPAGVRLRGSGQKITTIKLKASSNVNIIEQEGTSLGYAISDFTVDGNDTNNTQGGVFLVGTNNLRGPVWTVERITITKTRNCVMGSGVKSCFYIGGNTWSVVRDVDIVSNEYAQIALWVGGADSVYDGVYVGTNCNAFVGTVYGVFITSASNHFVNCYFGGSQPGDQVYITDPSGSANKFVNCVFDNGGGSQVRMVNGAVATTFTNCNFSYSSYTYPGVKYTVYNDVANSNAIFTGCRFDSIITAPTYDIPTYAYYEPSGTNGNAIITGCSFAGNYVSGFVSIPANSTTRFTNNNGYAISTAQELRVSTKVDIRGTPVDNNPPSVTSVPQLRVNNGGAISTWFGGYGYNYNWVQTIQDDGTNNLKALWLNPLGGDVFVGGNGGGITVTSPNGLVTRKISINNSGAVVAV